MDAEFLKQVEQFTNLKTSLDVKKRNALEKAHNKLIFAHDGGLFKADIQTITFVKSYSKERDLILLDTNDTPVKITDRNEFIIKAESSYFQSMNEYHLLYNDLKKQRSVKKVMDNE